MKHILLDWINTIDEPRCMVLNSLDNLSDGVVVVYIISSMLKKIGREKEIDAGSLERSLDGAKERFAKVFSVLSTYIDKTVFDESFSFESISNVINS